MEAAERRGGAERLPLLLLSHAYAGALALYLLPYRLDLRGRHKIATPVISIGNIVLGGVGKTPLVRWLCESLVNDGLRPCVVSCGYGGSICGAPAVVSDGTAIRLRAAEAGDEPVMLAQFLPGVPVVIGKRRAAAARLAERAFSPDLIVLDDGFQHWQLHRDLDVVVIDARRPFGNRRTIPAGPLREPLSALRRAGAVVLSHSDDASGNSLESLYEEMTRLCPGVPIHKCRDRPGTLRWVSDASGSGNATCAVSAIGTPRSFERSVIRAGLQLACAVRYPDHHAYTPQDLEDVCTAARTAGASRIVTTEKDIVRWPDGFDELPVAVLDTRVEVESGSDLLAVVKALCINRESQKSV